MKGREIKRDTNRESERKKQGDGGGRETETESTRER